MRATWVGMVLALGALVGCGGDDASDGPVTVVEQLVGMEGGELILTSGAKVEIPVGALREKTKIKISELDTSDVSALPTNLVRAGKPIAFEPHGTQFERAVKITVPFDSDDTEVRPVKLDDEADTSWQTVVGATKSEGKLELETTSFSIYMPAAPKRNSGVITLPDGATYPEDAGGDAAIDAGVDAAIEVDAGVDAAIASRCAVANGGCDDLTSCTDDGTAVTCGACPTSYTGDGVNGCVPELIALSVTPGTLSPAFDPTVTQYSLSVPLLTPRLSITASVPTGAALLIAGQSVPSGQATGSPYLSYGSNDVVLAAQHGANANVYHLAAQVTGGEEAYVKSMAPVSYGSFGAVLAFEGDLLAVGVPSETVGQNSGQGAVYLYQRSGGAWSYVTRLTAIGDPNDNFGASVAISGTTVVVGAPYEASASPTDPLDNRLPSAGAAYVFVRGADNRWTQQAYIKPAIQASYDYFGLAIDVDGDTLIVGASGEASSNGGINPTDDNNSNGYYYSGAAYVFARSGTTWSQQAYLKSNHPASSDEYACSVGVSGNTIVVGARGDDSAATGVNGDEADDTMYSPGAAHVYVRSGTTWSQQAYLKAAAVTDYDYFGQAVAIDGDLIVIGVPRDDSSATGVDGDATLDDAYESGAAYVFERSGTAWSQAAYLKASNTELNAGVENEEEFGSVVAIDGDTVVVGASNEDSAATGINGNQNDESLQDSGAAYVYQRRAAWQQILYVKASHPDYYDNFGTAVAVSGDTVVCGASDESSAGVGVNPTSPDATDNSLPGAGAVYVIR